MNIDYSTTSRKPPHWMSWTLAACVAVWLAVVLLIDLNGNVLVGSRRSAIGLMHPLPAILMLVSLGFGTATAVAHAIRYQAGRTSWIIIGAVLAVLIGATIAPVLLP